MKKGECVVIYKIKIEDINNYDSFTTSDIKTILKTISTYIKNNEKPLFFPLQIEIKSYPDN